jgi:HNH endonuclease/AP2 domain
MTRTVNWERRNFDAAFLRRILYYGAPTGYFFWLQVAKTSNIKVGSRAGFLDKTGYWMIGINGVQYSASHLAWLYITGEWPSDEIDHKNRIRHNDSWDNLRLATPIQNSMNRGITVRNTSGVHGVHWDKQRQRWEAHIRVEGIGIVLGSFDTLEEATAIRRAAEIQYFGEFAPSHAAE